jgi:general secretion pathway protein C
MEVYIKKYFWTLNIVVVMVCSVLAARGFNHVVEAKYLNDSDKPAKAPEVRPRPRPVSEPRSKSGEPLAKRNMFCSTCEPPQPEIAANAPADPNHVPRTSLPLQLVATNISTHEPSSFATIRNTSSNKEGAYWLGNKIPGAGEIKKISYKFVDFLNESSNRLERISLTDDAPPPVASTPEPVPGYTPPPMAGGQSDELTAAIDQGVKQIDEFTYHVDRSLVEKVLANPASVARGARIVPSIKDGKANGFKLYAIRPSSVYAKIGLKNGDTLHAINGYDLSTPDKALEVYTKLREASNLTVSVTRRGKTETLNYSIR